MNTNSYINLSKLTADRLVSENMSSTLQQIPLVLTQSHFSHRYGTVLCILRLTSGPVSYHKTVQQPLPEGIQTAKELTYLTA